MYNIIMNEEKIKEILEENAKEIPSSMFDAVDGDYYNL